MSGWKLPEFPDPGPKPPLTLPPLFIFSDFFALDLWLVRLALPLFPFPLTRRLISALVLFYFIFMFTYFSCTVRLPGPFCRRLLLRCLFVVDCDCTPTSPAPVSIFPPHLYACAVCMSCGLPSCSPGPFRMMATPLSTMLLTRVISKWRSCWWRRGQM